jgi:penicillin amidase
VEGLETQVDVYRDGMGIPHIYATTSHDLFFAQGTSTLRIASGKWMHGGTLARVNSPKCSAAAQVETDAFLRTLGWRQTAEAEWEQLGPNRKPYCKPILTA